MEALCHVTFSRINFFRQEMFGLQQLFSHNIQYFAYGRTSGRADLFDDDSACRIRKECRFFRFKTTCPKRTKRRHKRITRAAEIDWRFNLKRRNFISRHTVRNKAALIAKRYDGRLLVLLRQAFYGGMQIVCFHRQRRFNLIGLYGDVGIQADTVAAVNDDLPAAFSEFGDFLPQFIRNAAVLHLVAHA